MSLTSKCSFMTQWVASCGPCPLREKKKHDQNPKVFMASRSQPESSYLLGMPACFPGLFLQVPYDLCAFPDIVPINPSFQS